MTEDRKCELPRLVKFCVKRELQSLQLLLSPKLNSSGLHLSSNTHLCGWTLSSAQTQAGLLTIQVIGPAHLSSDFRKTNLGVYDMTSIQVQDHGRWL